MRYKINEEKLVLLADIILIAVSVVIIFGIMGLPRRGNKNSCDHSEAVERKNINRTKKHSRAISVVNIAIYPEKKFVKVASQELEGIILAHTSNLNQKTRNDIRKEITAHFSAGLRRDALIKKLKKGYSLDSIHAFLLAEAALSSIARKYTTARQEDALGSEAANFLPPDPFDGQDFSNWQVLKFELSEAKRSKNYEQVVKLCNDIIALSGRADFIGIVTPIFHKEAGSACLKLGDKKNALAHFRSAREKFLGYRRTKKLNNSDDYLRDIAILEKQIRTILETSY